VLAQKRASPSLARLIFRVRQALLTASGDFRKEPSNNCGSFATLAAIRLDSSADGNKARAPAFSAECKWETAMRLSLFILGVFAAVICMEIPAEAQNGGWCAYYDLGPNGFRSCRFATLQQC